MYTPVCVLYMYCVGYEHAIVNTYRVSEDSAILGELLQDIGRGGRWKAKHSHPTFMWIITAAQCLTVSVCVCVHVCV